MIHEESHDRQPGSEGKWKKIARVSGPRMRAERARTLSTGER